MSDRGFYGIAFYQPKIVHNWGTLVRSANIMGASFISVIGARYSPQVSDTLKSHRHMPIFRFDDFESFFRSMPYDCKLVGVELDPGAQELGKFSHPKRAIYLLGSEDNGLPKSVLSKCHDVIRLSGERSLNVSVAGSIVMYHREFLS